jgi:hypothetical protein
MPEQSALENMYFGSDVKGGISQLLGQEINACKEMPRKITLPEYVFNQGRFLLRENQTNEASTGFFYENGKWIRGKVDIGPKAKVVHKPGNFTIILREIQKAV